MRVGVSEQAGQGRALSSRTSKDMKANARSEVSCGEDEKEAREWEDQIFRDDNVVSKWTRP